MAGKWWVTTGGYPQLLVIRFKHAVQVDRVSQRPRAGIDFGVEGCASESWQRAMWRGLMNVRCVGQVMILCHGTYDVKLSWGDSHAPMDLHYTNAR